MAKPRPEPDPRAAAVALRTLEGRPDRSGRWLVVDERTGEVATALRARGGEVTSWFRWQGPWGSAHPGPAEGPFDQAVLRLPRSREALAYALERIAAVLVPGGALWLTGCNDEGVKAAGKYLAPWFTDAETLDTKHHARLWWAARTEATARGETADFLEDAPIDLPGGPVALKKAPGVFAGGGLDPASALLLAQLDGITTEVARVLDLGCGIGVLSAGVHQRWPEAQVTALDHDALAIAATRAGLPDLDARESDGGGSLRADDGPYQLIVSNPPLHGTSNDLTVDMIERMVRLAAERLTRNGRLVFVVQRQRPVERLLEATLRNPAVLADDGRFRVYVAQRRP